MKYVEPSQPPKGASATLSEIPNVVGGKAVAKEAELKKHAPANGTSSDPSSLPHTKSDSSLPGMANEEGEAVTAVAPSSLVCHRRMSPSTAQCIMQLPHNGRL